MLNLSGPIIATLLTLAAAHSPDGDGALTLRAENRSHAGLTAEVTADGHLMVDLEGRFVHVMAVRQTSEGEEEFGCFDEAEALRTFLEANLERRSLEKERE